ncbi:D-alanyl-D-alanine carboxypeptidase [Candidatus Paraburkholderia kirkii UZHbot1]|uniref:D-alanyl-D-alanine carboxypeptidase n=1 Tax=Candidatus Paraburkholderia kirkii UZHbot1 TaxID=1055526 RepID=G4M853_9BURK|nr:D-alanyl-D-alanine carboxypeptidase [Candidatus Paraburkholderia kirkii UZHbot1]
MPPAFSSVSRRLSSFALAALLACATLGSVPDAHARGGTKAESQAQAPERAAKGGAKARHAARGAKAEHAAKAQLPAGPLPASVMAALARAHVPLLSMSVVVQRIGAPVPLAAINANEPMLPASTMKLVTTYAGLSMLGPDYRWKTTAYADGALDAQGVLHGNLYIQGTGDPKLVPEKLIDLVDQIRKNGIMGIDGALVLDKRYFDASTRDLPAFDDDDSAPYNVGPDPLLYAFKSLSFTLTPGADGQVAIDVLPQLAQLRIDNELRVTRGACVGSLQAASPSVAQTQGGFVQASFIGDYPLRCGSRTVNVAALDHSTFFAGGFLALWKQAGGTFQGTTREGPTPSNARLVGTHRSPVLSDVVRDINKFSNNVMARNLFLMIGAAQLKPPATTAKSAQAIQAFLRRSALPMSGLTLDNGSGLSRDEHISAASLADLLLAANASPVAQVFVESLPIAGVDGTMRNRLTNAGALGNAHIKTGTLRDVRAIAGYVGAANGESYVVVSFINDPRAEAARAAHDALLEWVYEGARKPGAAD